jgi:prolyl-tRNA synthetase
MFKERSQDKKDSMSLDNVGEVIEKILNTQQDDLLAAAKKRLADNTMTLNSYDDFKDVFNQVDGKFVMAHWDGTRETEAQIKEETKATIRCIPLEGDKEPGECILTGKPSAQRVIFAKSY